MVTSNVYDRQYEVPGSNPIGRYGLWFVHRMKREYTQGNTNANINTNTNTNTNTKYKHLQTFFVILSFLLQILY